MGDYRAGYFEWANNIYFDEDTRNELMLIKNDKKEIEDRFFKELEFGTAGLRGVIGAGTNRMNKYTVRKATQGIAHYIKNKGEKAISKGVVIAYDSRRMSREFTEEAAIVLSANGIKTYLFNSLRATPQLSFAIRYLGCTAGIVITASHNPPEYNGYKVYGPDGGQVCIDMANDIISEVNKIEDYSTIKAIDFDEAVKSNMITILDDSIDKAFIEGVKSQILRQDIINEYGKDLKVIFTPIHGSGNKSIRRALCEAGFENVSVVKEQENPDPNFSTVEYPNPEEKSVFNIAIEMAKENSVMRSVCFIRDSFKKYYSRSSSNKRHHLMLNITSTLTVLLHQIQLHIKVCLVHSVDTWFSW